MAERRLAAAGVEAARLEARLFAAHALRVDRTWIVAHPEAQMNGLAGEVLLQRRESREPLAYILGWREFYGRRFGVRPGVLIPRQETETTVELALKCGDELGESVRVLDVGAGSGIIGITLKLERPRWEVTCSDISPVALEIAAENAETLGADVRLVQSDLLSAFRKEAFDLVVSNPPYIGREEVLDSELAFEPNVALYAENGGLSLYRAFAQQALGCKALVLEAGYRQATEVSSIFGEAGWAEIGRSLDLLGHERALAFRKR